MPYTLVKVSGSHTRVRHSHRHFPQENASLNKAVKLQQLNEYLIIIYDNCPVSSKQAKLLQAPLPSALASFTLQCLCAECPLCPALCAGVCVRAKLNVLQVLLQLGSAKWLKMCVPYATFGHENFATILVAFTLLI